MILPGGRVNERIYLRPASWHRTQVVEFLHLGRGSGRREDAQGEVEAVEALTSAGREIDRDARP